MYLPERLVRQVPVDLETAGSAGMRAGKGAPPEM
jgi:hypothetical protein